MPKQYTFLSLATHSKKLKCEKFLNEMTKVIPWKELLDVISPYYSNKKMGRKPMDLLMMIKIHCLQQWYNLSDPGMEEAIYDRISFQKFLKVDLLGDNIPDETTILNFRHLLEKNNLTKKIFETINQYLVDKGLLLREGTIVDATIISSPSSTKNKDRKRDPEMSSTNKNNNWFFGMKAHIGVDVKSGMVHSVESTTAKIHDKKLFSNLLHGDERAVFGDKAYADDFDKNRARDADIYWGVLDKAKRNTPLSLNQKRINKKKASIRAKVEHPFLVIKHLWKHRKTKYRGIKKNASQLLMLFTLVNLYKSRRKLLVI